MIRPGSFRQHLPREMEGHTLEWFLDMKEVNHYIGVDHETGERLFEAEPFSGWWRRHPNSWYVAKEMCAQ